MAELAQKNILLSRWLRHAVAAAMILVATSCGRVSLPSVHEPVYHCEAYDVWPDSIDFHSGVIVKAAGDSAVQIRVEGNTLREIRLPHAADGPVITTGIALFDALCRLESAQSLDSVVYTSLLPYELYLNPLCGKTGIELLEKREKNGYVVPLDTRLYSWPVINDNAQWLLAGAELFKVTGNRRWLAKLGDVASNVTAEDFRVAYNQSTGLIGGVPRHMAMADIAFPDWVEPVDMLNAASLSVNVAYWSALQALESITAEMARRNEKSHLPEMPFDADKLRQSVLTHFWMPNVGMFSSLCYGYPLWPVALKSADNIGQSLAVVTGMLSDAMNESVIGKTPVEPTGVTLFTPRWSGLAADSRIFSLTRLLWAVAASRTANDMACNAAIGALLYESASRLLGDGKPYQMALSPLQTVALRGMLGMRFASDGISFAPNVPSGMPGEKRVSRLRYRKSELEIILTGTGRVISEFKIDGRDCNPFFPASAEGKHTIEIVLSKDAGAAAGELNTTPEGMLPEAPNVEWVTPRNATVIGNQDKNGSQASGSKKYFVNLNGVMTDEFLSHHFELYQAKTTTVVQIVEVIADRWMSFSAKPHLYVPSGCSRMIYLSQWATAGTRIISDKKLAEKFVETNRWKNRSIKFETEVIDEGDYAVDVHYLYGLGIVNSRRRTALRSLDIDGSRCGIFVFPQLCAPKRDRESSDGWQSMTSFTNPVKVHLTPGRHILELKVYQPSPVYIDPYTNVVLADYVRIVRLP